MIWRFMAATKTAVAAYLDYEEAMLRTRATLGDEQAEAVLREAVALSRESGLRLSEAIHEVTLRHLRAQPPTEGKA